jgi:alpha 1,2-mannosyltransferase
MTSRAVKNFRYVFLTVLVFVFIISISKFDQISDVVSQTSLVVGKFASVSNITGVGGGPTSQQTERMNATFVTLCRNEDLYHLLPTIQGVEDRFNLNYHYSWVFLNDKEFSEEFKSATSALVSGEVYYGSIPTEQWSYPEWIDQEKAARGREELQAKKVIYGGSESYRHMCRYESGFFWRHPLLDQFKYYWRVEPDTKLHCDIQYDLFKFMEDNNKTYGFTISMYEFAETIPTLWKTTMDFLNENPQYRNSNPLLDFISADGGHTYNNCHFWSNFEIANLDFWRSDAYRAYFDYLDHSGGFFYERWGDAPVHSLAASLFLDQSEIHHFEDVGYFHNPNNNCPTNEETRRKLKCTCNPRENFSWKWYSCTNTFYKARNLTRPW